MGWSCSGRAGDVMDRWTAACRASTGSSNVFNDKGKSYFWEDDGREHDDGSVTGSVYLTLPNGRAREVSKFRIDGDGRVDSAPHFLRQAVGLVRKPGDLAVTAA